MVGSGSGSYTNRHSPDAPCLIIDTLLISVFYIQKVPGSQGQCTVASSGERKSTVVSAERLVLRSNMYGFRSSGDKPYWRPPYSNASRSSYSPQWIHSLVVERQQSSVNIGLSLQSIAGRDSKDLSKCKAASLRGQRQCPIYIQDLQ